LDFLGEKYFDDIICVADYEDETVNKLIKACKYRFVKDIAALLGEVLYTELKKQVKSGVCIPVPLSTRRKRWRGFNQATEIAKTVSVRNGLEYRDCLKKIRHTKAQAKLSEQARLLNLENCFVLKENAPDEIILIDDVITTGATLNECARVLRVAGAKKITIATVAKG
jgi:ComF family protein